MSDNWKQIEQAFAEASALAGDEREHFLSELDAAVAERVRELLAADADDLEPDAPIAGLIDSLAAETPDPWLGRKIGPWTLSERIGEGGMGAVFLAERSDDEYQQEVALKLMASRIVSREAIARFLSERQFLARLTHPNIARLLDGGSTDDGQPYLAMEYVDGAPIDTYCDEQRLSVGDRLKLFGKVCEAVDYAHRNLIVHRDLKPGNILVDENGEPKLLDFGIAKLLDPQTADHTLAMTRAGARVLTPEYASPEQVRGEPPAIATDVYALGVLLYRLLTGYSPYGKSQLSGHALEQAILSQDPMRPSTIVTEPTVAGEKTTEMTPAALSGQRHTSPERLRKRLLGDIDNIVLKALQKEPARRYASALQFRDDIENFLARRPVIARPDSLGYRTRKFVQRNFVGVTAAAVFVATIAGLVGFYTAQLADERDTAQLQAERAEQVSDFLTDMFSEASPAKNFGEPMNAIELLNTGAEKVSTGLTAQPQLRAQLALTIAKTYLTMRENKSAHEFLAPLLPEVRETVGEQSDLYQTLRSEYGAAVMHAGDRPAAREILQENLEFWQQKSPDSIQAAIAHRRVATANRELNDNEAAEPNYLRAIEILRARDDAPPVLLTDSLMGLGVLYRSENQYDAEEALLKEALEIQATCCGENHADYAGLVNNLAVNYWVRGWAARAEEQFRRHAELQKTLVGENGVAYANALFNLANTLNGRGDFDGALAMQIEAREIYGRGYGEDSVRYAYVTENIANANMHLKQYDAAATEFLRAMSIIESVFGADHVEYAFTQSNYGNMLVRDGQLDEGIANLEAAHAIFLEGYGIDHPSTVGSFGKLAVAFMEKEDALGARVFSEAGLAAAKRTWPDLHSRTIDLTNALARTYRMSGDYEEALAIHEEAIALAKTLDGEPQRLIIDAEIQYATTLKAAGDIDAARSLLEQKRDEIAGLDDDWDSMRERIDALLEND